jgi:hypothetical protein
MTENQIPPVPNPQPTNARQARSPNWLVALGLASLALLWPLVELTGVSDVLGRPATPLLILAAVFGTWVAVVGLGRVPQPVLTLTVTGLTYGVLVILLGVVFGDRGEVNGVILVIAGVFELGQATVFGAIAGLLASAVQNLRRAG